MKINLKHKISVYDEAVMIYGFLKFDTLKGGNEFASRITKTYANLRSDSGWEEILNATEEAFKSNLENLKEYSNKASIVWGLVENSFIDAVRKLFKYEFNDFMITSFPSLVELNPRNIKSKTFNPYINEKNVESMYMHEIMHFYFSEYISLNLNINSIDLEPYWSASEVFNNVVLSQGVFLPLQSHVGEIPYKDHQKLIPKAKKLFTERKNINEFINNLINLCEDK